MTINAATALLFMSGRRGDLHLTHLLARGIAALLTLAVGSSALLTRLTGGAPPLALFRDAGLMMIQALISLVVAMLATHAINTLGG